MRQAYEAGAATRMNLLSNVGRTPSSARDPLVALFRAFSAVLFLSFITAQAAVDGIVLNGATGKPQPGATVTLFRLGSANGPEALESVKSDPSGKFSIDKEAPGPRMLQAAFDGVTYSQVLTPASPSSGITLNVYPSSAKPGAAHIDQHMMLLEPTASNQLNISESFVWQNDGKSTFNDPDRGTLEFYLPPGSDGKVEINALAPGGMPIRRAAEKTSKSNIYKIDFPIKPGQSRIDLAYSLPFTSPGDFESKILYKGAPTRIVTPQNVTIAGAGVQNLGPGPQGTNATIYGVETPEFKVAITGTGSLKGDSQSDSGGDQSGQSIAQIMPRLFHAGSPNATFLETVASVKWVIVLTLGILALGFTLLYRAGTGESAKASSGSNRR
jgi:hypothetical protein